MYHKEHISVRIYSLKIQGSDSLNKSYLCSTTSIKVWPCQ